jgi:hypothetical protein
MWVGEWRLRPGTYWYGRDRIIVEEREVNDRSVYYVSARGIRPRAFAGQHLDAFADLMTGAQRIG